MSVILNLHEQTRPYKIDIFGLQDNYIGVLQSYEDNFIGQVIDPQMEIKDDGTQTFSCKIPKFYLDEIHNTKIINPRWQDCRSGILAENTRILKVFIQFKDELEPKIYPFIIDKITNKRDKDFSVYKEITCNGLAFAELGKLGYKIELNSTILEQDFKKDPTTLATLDYWLDKVFPNEKDENGEIIEWLTPWCYEIRMDWRGYLENFSDTSELSEKIRSSNKIYEDPYVSNWKVINNKLQPVSIEPFTEKARYVDCKNSNKYNITQTLAETFEVFCTYEYKCNSDGHFSGAYHDKQQKLWTGKKVIFFNRAIKMDNPLVINYQHNLQSISRIVDSSEIFTKMYVNSVQSETLDSGYISIADTTLNPLLDDFILNFDFLYQNGSINDLQKKEIENYEIQLHKLNSQFIEIERNYNDLIIKINELEAKRAEARASLESSQEQLIHYEKLRDSEVTNTPIIKNKTNSYSMWLTPQKDETKLLRGSFELKGINQSSIVGKGNYDKKNLFPTDQNPLITVRSVQDIDSSNTNNWYLINDEDGFPIEIYTSQENPTLLSKEDGGSSEDFFNKEQNGRTGVLIYFELEYLPKNKYIAICQRFENSIAIQNAKITELDEIIGSDNPEEWTPNTNHLNKQKKELEDEKERILRKKEHLNFRFERIMGPALREGYWQPDDYEDPGQGYNIILSHLNPKNQSDVSFIFDDLLFDGEESGYYYSSSENYEKEEKTYYPFIRLDAVDGDKKIYEKIGNFNNNKLSDFCITLQRTYFEWILQNDGDLKENTGYYFLLDGKYYSFKTKDTKYLKNDRVVLYTYQNSNPTISTYKSSNNQEIEETFETELLVKPPTQDNNLISTTRNFEGLTNYLSIRHLYNNSGFIFSFLKINNTVIPVALLNNKEINYSYYDKVTFSYNKNQFIEESLILKIQENKTEYPIVYPRIEIKIPNVNRDSENLKIQIVQNKTLLTKFEDYAILQRKEKTYITLKPTDINILDYILNKEYNIIFQVSKANEKLYLDAKRIAKDNSKPKYSYEIQKANLPQENNYIELGQFVYINDYSVDVFKEYGYVSGIKFQLDSPSKDQVTVSNYKTKFEDLFSSISAQNEAIRQNQFSYNIAAAAFTPSGEVAQDVLQTTLDNNDFAFNFSNTNITLDDSGGLVLTNTSNYSNGVYGQVALRGGGVFCSNSVDSNGNRIWTTGITPDGINASALNTGKIDTNLIRIFSGNSLAFQWNNEGLYAFEELQETTESGSLALNDSNYICLNKNGLLYVNNDTTALELGWNGLTIVSADGHVKLTSANGLQMLNDNGNPLVTFGKRDNIYGMFFTNNEGDVLLQATHDGNLQLIDTLAIGNTQDNNYVGLCGKDEYKDEITDEFIRFWAGAQNPEDAKFTVGEDGAVKVRKLFIQSSDGELALELNYEILEKLFKLV